MRAALFSMLFLAAACGEGPSIVVEPLAIVAWVPNRGAQCVAARADEFEAVVTFSDQLDTATVTAESLFVRREGEVAAVSGTVEPAGSIATLRVRVDLDYGAVYELVASEEIEGVERGRMAQALVSPFMTLSPAGCL